MQDIKVKYGDDAYDLCNQITQKANEGLAKTEFINKNKKRELLVSQLLEDKVIEIRKSGRTQMLFIAGTFLEIKEVSKVPQKVSKVVEKVEDNLNIKEIKEQLSEIKLELSEIKQLFINNKDKKEINYVTPNDILQILPEIIKNYGQNKIPIFMVRNKFNCPNQTLDACLLYLLRTGYISFSSLQETHKFTEIERSASLKLGNDNYFYITFPKE